MSSGYSDFINIDTSILWGKAWFEHLTFQELTIPRNPPPVILDRGSFHNYTLSKTLLPPPTDRTLIDLFSFGIPHSDDLNPLLRGLSDAYEEGYRSVVIAFEDDHSIQQQKHYHFAAINTMDAIHKHITRYLKASRLWDHISLHLSLPKDVMTVLGQTQILTSVAGLHQPVPFTDLESLLGEERLWEDLYNALLELIHFEACARNTSNVETPAILLFSTFLYEDIANMSRCNMQARTETIRRLQHAIRQPHFKGIMFAPFIDGHVSSFMWTIDAPIILSLFDSLGQTPTGPFSTIMEWLLQGTYRISPKILNKAYGPVQGPDSGSCAIAVLNWTEQLLGLTKEKWNGDTSSRSIRDRFLSRLAIYHTVVCQDDLENEWYLPAFELGSTKPSPEVDPFMPTVMDLTDFTLVLPSPHHPIHKYLSIISNIDSTRGGELGISHFTPSPPPPPPPRPRPRQRFPKHENDDGSLPQPQPEIYHHPPSTVKTPPKTLASQIKAMLDSTTPTPPPNAQKCGSNTATAWSPWSLPRSSVFDEKKQDEDPSTGNTSFTPDREEELEKGSLGSFHTPSFPRSSKKSSILSKAKHRQIDTDSYSDSDKSSTLSSTISQQRNKLAKAGRHLITSVKQHFKRSGSIVSPSPIPKVKRRQILDSDEEEIRGTTMTVKGDPGTQTCPLFIDSASEDDLHSLHANDTLHDHHPSPNNGQFPEPLTHHGMEAKEYPINLTTGQAFDSLEEALEAVYHATEAQGFQFRKGQSRKDSFGRLKKYRLLCNCTGVYRETKKMDIDPSQHRHGKTARCACPAVININKHQRRTQWIITRIQHTHNHYPQLPDAAKAKRFPTAEQRAQVKTLIQVPKLGRHQLSKLLELQTPHNLEPRQITNIISKERRQAQEDLTAMGGDFGAIRERLEGYIASGAPWVYNILLDGRDTITALFWASPEQAHVARRHGDILINDNAFNRNQYNYPLNIGIAIDEWCQSRIIWYCIQANQTAELHEWVWTQHIALAGRAPDKLVIDAHASLLASAPRRMPETHIILCLHHIITRMEKHFSRSLGDQWQAFMSRFWVLYRSDSPTAFDQAYDALVEDYPITRGYLDSELYPMRDRWAWAWIGTTFTAGIRTTGRAEAENRINKLFSGSKVSGLASFDRLNQRTKDQNEKNIRQYRENTKQRLTSDLESLFGAVIAQSRQYCGPFAHQTLWREMERSTYYQCTNVTPVGGRDWNSLTSERFNGQLPDREFLWGPGQENEIRSTFQEDQTYISTSHMLTLIREQSDLRIRFGFKVQHGGNNHHAPYHILLIFKDGRYFCDCLMGINLGVTCRHFFAVMVRYSRYIHWHVGFIRARWLRDPNEDVNSIPPTSLTHTVRERINSQLTTALPSDLISNPIDICNTLSRSRNETMGARRVHAEAVAEVETTLGGIFTEDQMEEWRATFRKFGDELRNHAPPPPPALSPMTSQLTPIIRDPPIRHGRGRPREARITSATEPVQKGGGGSKKRAGENIEDQATNRKKPRQKAAPLPPQDSPTPPLPEPSQALPISRKRKRSLNKDDGHNDRPRREVSGRCRLCHQTGHTALECYDVTVETQREKARMRRQKK